MLPDLNVPALALTLLLWGWVMVWLVIPRSRRNRDGAGDFDAEPEVEMGTTTCQRCGGNIRLVYGRVTCLQCGHAPSWSPADPPPVVVFRGGRAVTGVQAGQNRRL